MIQQILTVSLICAGLHVASWEGNVFGGVRAFLATWLDRAVGKKWSRYIQKPLWDCLPCMASVWTILFTWSIDPWLILAVCGLNSIIERIIKHPEDAAID